mmetsp:Transcript_12321/g.15967  ORF Transcript_12321/g.15967 Transcript_12321/m.15967 type:complete len:175 (+) Transcript_12321:202-726(+)|eukprot:CAMPEP_0184022784 /NCGR_PEP_ID=MMETSP0954-20121128/10863_1 /TAXON_ID=627963 /ORGANISM="Aplanochytrium sp, Strain PBS07" /LENGTH=174 /DNA_ID=CAMNT_0026305327 /DNA_START=110 /DNA_END=634 /DNA_ORIENTATION=+
MPEGEKSGLEALIEVILREDVYLVKQLLNEGVPANGFVDYVEIAYMYDWTPLHAAARKGNLEIARILIEAGADVNASKAEMIAPLEVASSAGHIGVVKLLLNHGAEVNHTNLYNQNALAYAAKYGHTDVVELLVEHGIDISIRDDKGRSPLDFFLATNKVDKKMVQLLTPKKKK